MPLLAAVSPSSQKLFAVVAEDNVIRVSNGSTITLTKSAASLEFDQTGQNIVVKYADGASETLSLTKTSNSSVPLHALPVSPDSDGLAEFSVVYTDRARNHMSASFQATMRNLSTWLKEAYSAEAAVLIPGSGTAAMEAVARQFGTGAEVLVLRNGLFSYRWSQIFAAGKIPSGETVLKAQRSGDGGARAPFAPAKLEEVLRTIRETKPAVVFAPHCETSSGILLPNDYITAVSAEVHKHGGLFVLDGIASGCVRVNMQKLGVDVYVSAPQKGWSGPACVGIAMLSAEAVARLATTPTSTSFFLDLAKWHQVMQAYVKGGHMYHATMPTDSITAFEHTMAEMRAAGLDKLEQAQWELGRRVWASLEKRGAPLVAADGFRSPGVVVAYTSRDDVQNTSAFRTQGVQVAAGVPLFVDEGSDFKTFRLGLLGVDKLADVDATVARLDAALGAVGKF